jgi:site-specific DNA-methyltransferase (adenine-specific)
MERGVHAASTTTSPTTLKRPKVRAPNTDFIQATPVPATPFVLREDGSIGAPVSDPARSQAKLHRAGPEDGAPIRLVFSSDTPFVRLYHGNCLELLDAIAAKYPESRFDAIFADPPYFLSNGGITCHAGKMVRVDKGDWDKSRGPELNHEFNLEWLARCQRVLKPNGTIWVSGTQHVIFSIGYAMQQLGYKVLNDIAWEKPNPPPNLSCRYFTHSTETILWAAKNEKSKHVFNYQEMRKVTGKQMKTVWRKEEFDGGACHPVRAGEDDIIPDGTQGRACPTVQNASETRSVRGNDVESIKLHLHIQTSIDALFGDLRNGGVFF